MVNATAMIANSVSDLDLETCAVTRCDFAAGSQRARLRQANAVKTTASPSVAAPAQSASARTTVATGAPCGSVNAHAAADAPTTTTKPPIIARVVTSFVVPPKGFHRR